MKFNFYIALAFFVITSAAMAQAKSPIDTDPQLQKMLGRYVLTKNISDPVCVTLMDNPTQLPLIVKTDPVFPESIIFSFYDEKGRDSVDYIFDKINAGVQKNSSSMDSYGESHNVVAKTDWDGKRLTYSNVDRGCWLFFCDTMKESYVITAIDENHLSWNGQSPLESASGKHEELQKGCFFERN